MEGCEWSCVLMIWGMFLYPVIITFSYYVFAGKNIKRRGNYIWKSILAGYGSWGMLAFIIFLTQEIDFLFFQWLSTIVTTFIMFGLQFFICRVLARENT